MYSLIRPSVLGSNEAVHSYNGTLLSKIGNFKKKRQDAINGIKLALYSPPLYSCQYGYKMYAKIYMNGDGFGKGAHLSLFFVVLNGTDIRSHERFSTFVDNYKKFRQKIRLSWQTTT